VHVPRYAVKFGTVALGGADRFEPDGAALDDVGDAAESFDVVDDGRLAKGSLDCRKGGFDARPAALSLEAFDQAGFLAADIGPCSAMGPDIEVEAAAVDILADMAGGAGLLERPLEHLERADVFKSKVDISRCRPGCKAGDQDSLQELVGILFDEQAVIERRRLALVAVDAHQGFLPVLRKECPFQAAREA